MSQKGVSEILSAVIIIVLAIGLVATGYTYGLPLIKKTQGEAVADRVRSSFDQSSVNSLPSKIEDVANARGTSTFSNNVDGLWKIFACVDKKDFGDGEPYSGCVDSDNPVNSEFKIVNNSIEFTFSNIVSDINPGDGWQSLTPASTCPPQTTRGTVGQDKSSVVCARADANVHGEYNITYRIHFRELIDPSLSKGFKISLVPDASSSTISTGKTVRVSFDRVEPITIRIEETGKEIEITNVFVRILFI
jgi:hypothetical protein